MLMSDSYDMFNRRAVFIDRDGTVVKADHRVASFWEAVKLIEQLGGGSDG